MLALLAMLNLASISNLKVIGVACGVWIGSWLLVPIPDFYPTLRMDTPRLRVLSLVSLLLAGCGPSATTSSGSPRTAVVTNSWAFEGVYIDKNYGDRPIVTLQAGRYTGALPANPGGDINGAGRYSARELGNGKWELKLNYDTGGASTVTVREIAGGIAIRDLAYGGETRLVRK